MGIFFRFHPSTRPIPFNSVPVPTNGVSVVKCPTLQWYPISEPSTAGHSRGPSRDFRAISALSLQGEDALARDCDRSA